MNEISKESSSSDEVVQEYSVYKVMLLTGVANNFEILMRNKFVFLRR